MKLLTQPLTLNFADVSRLIYIKPGNHPHRHLRKLCLSSISSIHSSTKRRRRQPKDYQQHPTTSTTYTNGAKNIVLLNNNHQKDQNRDMKQFYTIDENENMDKVNSAATSSVLNLDKYLQNSPIPNHTLLAFETFLKWYDKDKQLCIDAGCGQAFSSLKLSHVYQQNCQVLGIDKSIARLNRNAVYRHSNGLSNNSLILQADLVHFWKLCWEHQIFPSYQYFFYPNPYPKTTDIKKRWYGHPVFPIIVALGGRIEIRSSWLTYVNEFKQSYQTTFNGLQEHRNDLCLNLNQRIHMNEVTENMTVEDPITSFERKYMSVGLPVHRLIIDSSIKT